MIVDESLIESSKGRPAAAAAARSECLSPTRAKEIYREFSRSESSIPIFSRDWWLDATAGPEDWHVSLVKKSNHVVAAMPYFLRRRYGMNVISQPRLTQKLGPWFRPSDSRSSTRLANEKDLMQALIDQLPKFDHFSQNWHYNYTNWLPFFWNGFHQSTRYTYVLTDLAQTEKLWDGFHHNIRNECRKAESRFKLKVRDDLPLDIFLGLNRMTFARQKISMPYRETFVRRLEAVCAEHNCRKFFVAVDAQGRHHAGLYIVWDENSAYGLMTGSDPELRTSGAVSLCFWEAIKHASRVTRCFDFGGSMLEPIERYFRKFGADQVPYFNVNKTPSMLLRVRQSLLPAI